MAAAGCKKAAMVEGYFCHETQDILFTLVVDDFLIKCHEEEDLEHLMKSLRDIKCDTTAYQ